LRQIVQPEDSALRNPAQRASTWESGATGLEGGLRETRRDGRPAAVGDFAHRLLTAPGARELVRDPG